MRRLQVLTALKPELGTWSHLVARFFDVVTSPRLTEAEADEVAGFLAPGERPVFFAQPRADQRHGLSAARSVLAVGGRRELARAALLHDVGKRHARLGPLGRVLAAVSAGIGVSPGGRIGAYVGHGPLAAAELAELGAEALVVDYAASHHADRPSSIDEADWAVLQAADRARRLRPRRSEGA